MLAFPSTVAAGTTASSPTPANIYYAFNNAYPQMMPGGVSVDLRSGLLWTRAPVRPNVMIDSSGLVKNISDSSMNNTPPELPINSINQWRIPSLSIAQALINGAPNGVSPVDWLSKNTQDFLGISTFDSLANNLSSKAPYVDSVLGSSSYLQTPYNTSDLQSPWGTLVNVSGGYNSVEYPINTRAYGIMTLSNIDVNLCSANQAMFGPGLWLNGIQPDVTCLSVPIAGNLFPDIYFSPVWGPAATKNAYQLLMLDQTQDNFNMKWQSCYPSMFRAPIFGAGSPALPDCTYGGFHSLVLRDTSMPVYNDGNDVIVHGFGIPKDYAGHYVTALVHEQSKDKVFSRQTRGSNGSVGTLLHAPSFTLIPDDWALNTNP
jgi:hypothetical protein